MTSRRSIPALVIAAVVVAAGSQAWAGVPSPAQSTVDECIRVCPGGDMNLHVAVRDASANPVSFSNVVVDLSGCSGILLCPLNGSEPYTIAPGALVIMTADAAGIADIPLRAGGTCNGGPVGIYADGFLLAQRSAVSSPDQTGDAVVNAADQSLLAGKVAGPFDPTGDLNCSAGLGPGDVGILNAHLGHACSAVVPVWPRSWGVIKSLYR